MPAVWYAWFPYLCLRAIWDQTGTTLSYFSPSSLAVMFSEKIVLCNWLSEEGAFTQCDKKIIILHIWEWVESWSITFNHVQNISEHFRTKSRAKLRNVIEFDTVTSFACAWCITKSNTIRNNYNPLNSFESGGFLKESFGNFQYSDT